MKFLPHVEAEPLSFNLCSELHNSSYQHGSHYWDCNKRTWFGRWLGLPSVVLITSADFCSHFEAAPMKYFLLHHNTSMALKLVWWLRDENRKTRLHLDKLQSVGLRTELRVRTNSVDGYVINTTTDTPMLGFHWNQWLRRLRRSVFVVENPIWDSDFYRHFSVLYCKGSIRFVTGFTGICECISRMQMT